MHTSTHCAYPYVIKAYFQINMEYKCKYEGCQRAFATNTELTDHIKRRHNTLETTKSTEPKTQPTENPCSISEAEILKETACDQLDEIEQLVFRNKGIANIESYLDIDISRLHNLTFLCLSHNNIKQLTGIKQFNFIEELNISFNFISDIAPLAELKSLVKLYASNNDIKDISPLCQLTDLK